MKEQDLFDLLQNLMPVGLQFINPYIDKATVPKGDWAVMNIINIEDKGRSQERQIDYTDKRVSIAYDQTRIYTVQFDFYGKNALDNCTTFKQTLQIELDRLSKTGKSTVGLKTMGIIRNLTELLENKLFLKRYSFDFDLFVIDTIEQERNYLLGANITVKPYSY